MNVNKGSRTLNYLFGVFILLNTVKVGCDLYARYRKVNMNKPCACKKCSL